MAWSQWNRQLLYNDYDLGETSNFHSNCDSGFDLNQVNVCQLQNIPGIGRTLAERIVNYRELNGPFYNFNDLLNIRGIGRQKIITLENSLVISHPIRQKNYHCFQNDYYSDEPSSDYRRKFSTLENDKTFNSHALETEHLPQTSRFNIKRTANPQFSTNYDLGETSDFHSSCDLGFDLNQVNVCQLQNIPGIGRTLAERIVNYRELNGPFYNFNDLLNIRGIGRQKIITLENSLVISHSIRQKNYHCFQNDYYSDEPSSDYRRKFSTLENDKTFNSHALETEYLPQTSIFNIKRTKNPQLVTSSFGEKKALNYPDQPPSSSILQVPEIRKTSSDQIFQYKEINSPTPSSKENESQKSVKLKKISTVSSQNKSSKPQKYTNIEYDFSFNCRFKIKKEHFKSSAITQYEKAISNFSESSNLQHVAMSEPHTTYKHDINKATVFQLQQIPGIGLVLAQRIVLYREHYGPFQSFCDLLNIKGIGKEKVSTIQQFSIISTGDQTAAKKHDKFINKNILEKQNNKQEEFSNIENKILEEKYDETPKTSVKALDTSAEFTQKKNTKIDLNKASQQELRQIPEINIKLAIGIVHYRETIGPFTSFDNLYRVRGIRKEHVASIKKYVKIFDQDRFTTHSGSENYVKNQNDVKCELKFFETSKAITGTQPYESNENTKIKLNTKKKNFDLGVETIDFNQATVEQLTLPGISKNLAQQIVAFRQKYGFIHNLDHITVPGFGKAKLEILKENFHVTPTKNQDEYNLPPYVYQLVEKNLLCENVSEKKFQGKTVSKKQMFYFHANIDGLEYNFQKLEKLLNPCKYSPDVICITESNKPNKEKIQLDNYKLVVTPFDGRKGGAAIYTKTDIFVKEWHTLKFDVCKTDCEKCGKEPKLGYENLWIEIKRKHGMNVIIGAVYRHPNDSNFDCFTKKLKDLLAKLKNEKKRFYIFGDFNLNMFKALPKIERFCNIFYKHNFKLLITKPTRTSGTLIDHIYTNDKIKSGFISGIVTETEEKFTHHPIYCIV